MKPDKTIIRGALALVLGTAAMGANAAVLNTGDVLTINTGIASYDTYGNFTNVVSGSWFGCDCNGDYKIVSVEKTPINAGPVGVVIGSTQSPGQIDNWVFFGIAGQDYTTVAPTGGTNGLDLSGWHSSWNYNLMNFGGGAWQPLNCTSLGCTGYTFTNGMARFQWDGIYGHTYTLDYTARVPQGDGSGFDSVPFYFHLQGTVNAVPVPAAFWLFGSGLAGLLGLVRRNRKNA
jgi:hypothetical protein